MERPALDQRWYKTLKIIFCIGYDLVPANDELCETVNIRRERRNLGTKLVGQYLELNKMITDYLVPNFTLRNKIQQGEWKYAFKPKYSKEYSYEKNIRKINFEIQKIVNPNLENFISEIVNREIRGKTYRRN